MPNEHMQPVGKEDVVPSILIVDDEPDILDILHDVLSGEGFNVTCAPGGGEAVEMFQAKPFDLVVTDMKMPGMRGDEVIKQIKRMDGNTEIIVLTGYASMEDAVNSLKYGAFDYMTKPLEDLDQFINTVRQALAKRQLVLSNIKLGRQLEDLATHDPLTGLPNRRMFNDCLELAIKKADRGNKSVSLLIIDLDHFKNVNDTLGHNAGDNLLVQATDRMEKCIRETDILARVGGDEFFLIVEDAKYPQYTANVARRIIQETNKPFSIDGNEVRIGASIGIAVYPSDGDDAEVLVKHADIAMYRVKNEGRNNYQFFTEEMSKHVRECVELNNELRNAVLEKEFHIHYLPVFNIKTDEIIGVEALLRWNNPERGTVKPDVFIPLMEQAGIMDAAFQWLLETSCGQCQRWREKSCSNLKLSVNVSPTQFNSMEDFDISETIEKVLAAGKCDPGLLWIEITGGLFREDENIVIDSLRRIKSFGIGGILLDDFGAGFSSLPYLKTYPFDGLKIDRELIKHVHLKSDTATFVAAIVAMGFGLNMKTIVAEGLEFKEQLPILREFGCTAYQGYLHSRPMSAEIFENFLQRMMGQMTLPPPNGHDIPKSHRILVVEDNAFNRRLMQSILVMHNYLVDVAGSAEEALEQTGRNRYSLIITDIVMPDMKGYELCGRIREAFSYFIPIIGITAYDTVEIQRFFSTSGMNDYLLKPVSPEELISTVRKWLLVVAN